MFEKNFGSIDNIFFNEIWKVINAMRMNGRATASQQITGVERVVQQNSTGHYVGGCRHHTFRYLLWSGGVVYGKSFERPYTLYVTPLCTPRTFTVLWFATSSPIAWRLCYGYLQLLAWRKSSESERPPRSLHVVNGSSTLRRRWTYDICALW